MTGLFCSTLQNSGTLFTVYMACLICHVGLELKLRDTELYRTNFVPENNKHLHRELLLAHHMPQLSKYYLGSLYSYDFFKLVSVK